MVSLAEPVAAREAAPPRSTGRLAALDGLRLLAALMVVAFHYTYRAGRQWGVPTIDVFPHVYHVTQYGRLGVELFFVISGFVICMSAWGRSLVGYFLSRVTRLYPAYWFAVLLTTAVLIVLGDGGPWEERPTIHELLMNLTMLQSWLSVRDIDSVYWTLGVELHFYLLFAIVVWRGLTYRRVVLFCVLWTVAALAVPSTTPVLGWLVDPTHAPYFIAGVAMYLMYRFRPTVLLWGIVGVSYALAVHQMLPTLDVIHSLSGRPVSFLAGLAVMTGIFAAVLAISLGWLNRVRGAWLTTAGVLTYPLYLLHQNIGWLVIHHLHGRVPAWPLVIGLVAAMMVAAWSVHRLVERPLAPRLKRALTAGIAEAATDGRSGRS